MNKKTFFALWRKEWHLLQKSLSVALGCSYLALAWFIAAALVEYLALAPQLAQLKNQKGATEMVLGVVNDFLKWLWVSWSIFFAARILAQEKQWYTQTLFYAFPPRDVIGAKALFLGAMFLALALPFWLSVLFLSQGITWDKPLLAAQALAQILWLLYALALGLCFSSFNRQALSASLGCALFWLLLWLLPSLTQSPIWREWLYYLSPFEHFDLLQRGVVSVQTLFYFGSSIVFFGALTLSFWRDAS